MKKTAIYILRFGLNLIYVFLKLFPVQKGKVVFLSRQSDDLTLDFAMTQKALEEKMPQIKIVTICNRLEGEKSGGVGHFAISTLRSMYHMATSQVCVLDAYWPAASLLHHKKNLTIIQMWHALGKIKQSGYQTLGKESGRGSQMAHLMKMHENYDYILAGGRAWNEFYCKSFNTTEDKLINCGLPRIDHLLQTAEENRKKVLQAYPEFDGKTVILYAPTFRKNIELHWENLIEAVKAANQTAAASQSVKKELVLIIKGHPNQQLRVDGGDGENIYSCSEFKSVDLLSTCDYLITDYSAIAIEGAVLNRPTYYFVYDYEEYREKNGMNIDLFQVMPECVFRDAPDIIEKIQESSYNQSALDSYRQKYLPENLGTSTQQIVDLIIEEIEK